MFAIIDFKDLETQFYFENPLAVYRATSLDEVKTVLANAEKAQKAGNYVVGYVSYEAAKAFDAHFEVKSENLDNEAYALFMVFDKKAVLAKQIDENLSPLTWQSSIDKATYDKGIAKIKSEIRLGNTYQVNYTMGLKAVQKVDTRALFTMLNDVQGARYNAYYEFDDFSIASLSPELFFEVRKGILRTRPMKGTARRGITFEKDAEIREWLYNDEKNRAENLMITDLLRNDMGRISEIDSVNVTHLTTVEQYHTVWQMTSTIESKLRQKLSLIEIFEALFPCGSITGAPKIATMKIIDQIEPKPRGVYCGTLGILLPDGDMIFNVAIRTIQTNRNTNTHYYGVGGGITWDSQADDEYQETIEKSEILKRKALSFQLISTGHLVEGKLSLEEAHFARLEKSAAYYAYPFSKEKGLLELKKIKQHYAKGDYRLKISLDKEGCFHFELKPFEMMKTPLQVTLKQQDKTVKAQSFTYFKTDYRLHRADDCLYYDGEGYLTEGSFYNLIIEKDGKWWTPQEEKGLLLGLFIQKLLKERKVAFKNLTLEDLKSADKIYGCNALRGVFELNLKESDS